MMPHPRPRGGRWLLGLALGCAWLLAGQHLAGHAGADQGGRPQAATVAPSTSTPVQHRPAAQPRPAPTQHRPTSPPSSTRTSTRSSTGSSPQQRHSTGTSPPTSQTARGVAFALAQQGKPYQWGAEGPDAYDCSGLVWLAWQHAGLEWERMTAAGQWRWLHDRGHEIPATKLRPGDLLFYANDSSDPASIHHVAMAVDHGRMVEAPEPGVPVRVRPLRWSGLFAAARPTV